MEKQSEGNKRNRSTSGGRYQEALSNRSFTFLNVAFNPIKMEHTSTFSGGILLSDSLLSIHHTFISGRIRSLKQKETRKDSMLKQRKRVRMKKMKTRNHTMMEKRRQKRRRRMARSHRPKERVRMKKTQKKEPNDEGEEKAEEKAEDGQESQEEGESEDEEDTEKGATQ